MGSLMDAAPATGQLIADARNTRGKRDWSLTSRRNELVKIGVRIVTHTRYVALQMIEVAATRESFQGILPLIDGLRTGPRVRHLGNGG
jgi:hypothetical protein